MKYLIFGYYGYLPLNTWYRITGYWSEIDISNTIWRHNTKTKKRDQRRNTRAAPDFIHCPDVI